MLRTTPAGHLRGVRSPRGSAGAHTIATQKDLIAGQFAQSCAASSPPPAQRLLG